MNKVTLYIVSLIHVFVYLTCHICLSAMYLTKIDCSYVVFSYFAAVIGVIVMTSTLVFKKKYRASNRFYIYTLFLAIVCAVMANIDICINPRTCAFAPNDALKKILLWNRIYGLIVQTILSYTKYAMYICAPLLLITLSCTLNYYIDKPSIIHENQNNDEKIPILNEKIPLLTSDEKIPLLTSDEKIPKS